MADLALVLEAEKRGILPADKRPLLEEARRRGLVPGVSHGTSSEVPDWQFGAGPPKGAQPPAQERGIVDQAIGVGEAALTAASAVGAVPAATGQTLASGVTNALGITAPKGKRGDQQYTDLLRRYTYEPRTEAGKEAVAALGKGMDASKLAGLGPTEAIALGGAGAPGGAAAARRGAEAVGETAGKVAERARGALSPAAPEMAGVGAAKTAPETMRRERAAQLPVPVRLTKGQATRDFAQQQFERETAKNPEAGKTLRERFVEQNQQILQNFDAWIDQTGAQTASLRATGQVVNDAIVEKSKRAKTEIRTAYDKARISGAMNEPVDVGPIGQYLQAHQAEAINAPVLTSVQQKLAGLAKGGQVSIGDLEEVRKMVGVLGGKDATNAHFAREVKQLIDTLTDGKGGAEYKNARRLRARYGEEFERQGVIDRVLSTKPGTSDRAVAHEDIFAHTILKGSLDDVRAVRKTLQTAGPEGEQAWKELQGATVKHLKEEMTKGVSTDQAGNPVISPARLNALVAELDKDGKLDFIFGKKGAEQIRDANGIAKDAFTAPPGSVNTSNTASILIGLLDAAVSGTAGMPLPIGTAANFAVKKVRGNALNRRVVSALDDPSLPHVKSKKQFEALAPGTEFFDTRTGRISVKGGTP